MCTEIACLGGSEKPLAHLYGRHLQSFSTCGVTYEQLAELTGEPMGEVNFYLPANNIPLLRQIKGFEDFDPQTEVLHCDKPGTGLVDAPRAFSIQLKGVTEKKCQMVSSQIDPAMPETQEWSSSRIDD